MPSKKLFTATDIQNAPFAVTAHGIHWLGSKTGKEAPNPDEVARARAWLAAWATPRKTPNPKIGSYGLKHAVERWAAKALPGENPYVSNGAFIQAALDAGYAIQVDQTTPNCQVCASVETWLKAERAR